jgi:nucleoid-associated protein
MKIHYAIIHELQKSQNATGAKIIPSEETLDISEEKVIRLITELNNRYLKRNQKYGMFDANNPTRFHGEFKDYMKGITNESLFIQFSKNTANDLKEKIETIAPAKGGFLVYTYYENYGSFVGIFLIRDTTGMLFEKGKNKYTIHDSTHVDFEKMAMACRINIKMYKSGDEERYLSFIHQKGDAMSKYFTSWISSADLETDREDTQQLYDLLKMLPPPKDENGILLSQEEFLANAYSVIKTAPDRIVKISELSEHFFSDANYVANFADQNQIPINSEFKAHNGVLKKFIQIRAKAEDIEIAFPQNAYKEKVWISDSNPTQIVIQSQELVNKLREAIISSN